MDSPLMPLVLVIAAYLVLQIILNLLLRLLIVRQANRAMASIVGSFWAGVISALYFIIATVLLHISGTTIDQGCLPPHTLWWSLAGIPAGILLWLLLVKARGLGIRLFGKGELIAGEDAILRVPPSLNYISWGVLNQSLIQPLGRELFMRGVLWSLVVTERGVWTALLVTVVIEVLFRLNVIWLFATLVYALWMVGIYTVTGSVLPCLVAAVVNGLLHSTALAYMGMRELRSGTGLSQTEDAACPAAEDSVDEAD